MSFDEACSVFADLFARIFADEGDSNGEQREIIIGRSVLDRLLVVSFVESEHNRVRIISARKATKRERKDYEENVVW